MFPVVAAEKPLVAHLFRFRASGYVLGWLADRGILRVWIEESFKRSLLREQGARVAAEAPERQDDVWPEAAGSASRR